jgi:hypothetical protein
MEGIGIHRWTRNRIASAIMRRQEADKTSGIGCRGQTSASLTHAGNGLPEFRRSWERRVLPCDDGKAAERMRDISVAVHGYNPLLLGRRP